MQINENHNTSLGKYGEKLTKEMENSGISPNYIIAIVFSYLFVLLVTNLVRVSLRGLPNSIAKSPILPLQPQLQIGSRGTPLVCCVS